MLADWVKSFTFVSQLVHAAHLALTHCLRYTRSKITKEGNEMRKFIAIILVAVLFTACIACADKNLDSAGDGDLPTDIYIVGVDINGEVGTQYDPANPSATFPPENIITTNPGDTVGEDVDGNPSTVYNSSEPSATFPPSKIIVKPSATAAPTSVPVTVSTTSPGATAPGTTAKPNTTPEPTLEPFEGTMDPEIDTEGSTVVDFEDLFGTP